MNRLAVMSTHTYSHVEHVGADDQGGSHKGPQTELRATLVLRVVDSSFGRASNQHVYSQID